MENNNDLKSSLHQLVKWGRFLVFGAIIFFVVISICLVLNITPKESIVNNYKEIYGAAFNKSSR
jgi:hypothetical protein